MKIIYSSGLAFALLLFGSMQAKEPVKQTFTPMELAHISAKTQGLFASGNKLEIHLDALSEKDYCFPLAGAKVISDYGGVGNRKRHSGVDLKTRANDTIRCAFNGIVRMSKPYYAYGNVVVVRHSSGLETVYSHNSKNLVHPGDTVRVGQPIALTGRTGRATTEHLHFETRINGEHFNPHIIFSMKNHALRKECVRCTKSAQGIIVKPILSK